MHTYTVRTCTHTHIRMLHNLLKSAYKEIEGRLYGCCETARLHCLERFLTKYNKRSVAREKEQSKHTRDGWLWKLNQFLDVMFWLDSVWLHRAELLKWKVESSSFTGGHITRQACTPFIQKKMLQVIYWRMNVTFQQITHQKMCPKKFLVHA